MGKTVEKKQRKITVLKKLKTEVSTTYAITDWICLHAQNC